jgi:superfamily II DNA or RNA helicase
MPHGIYENIKCDTDKHPTFTPQKHQEELLDYFLNKSKYKGVLAFHRLGSGKSCSSIMISDEMIKKSKTMKIFIMTPGSLRQNFIEEYCKKCGYKPRYLKKHYTFITSNYSVGDKLPNFDGGLVIIDEVHNLINGVKNQSKHATLIYNKLMRSKCRILALTGTPVFNYIWEWPLLGNLLKPGTFTKIIRDGVLDKEAFMLKFIVDEQGNVQPKKPRNFAMDLKGIISYFPGIGGGFYPEVVLEKPIQTLMTIPQNSEYWNLATWEGDIRRSGPPKKSLLRSNPRKYTKKMEEFIMASKYIMSRSNSNFYYPEEYKSSRDEISKLGKVLKYKNNLDGEIKLNKKDFFDIFYKDAFINLGTDNPTKEQLDEIYTKTEIYTNKNITKEYIRENIGWINKKSFNGNKLTDIYSRKMVAVITNIATNWKSKHVVFTFFKTKAGVNMLHSLFKMCGIRTEIYSGDISDYKRKTIINEFNAEKNRYGDDIKILLVTEAGAEGINLLETQHMHILESSTREMKIQQAIGRVVRYKSHMVDGRKPMRKHEQVVHVWRYWSVSSDQPFSISKTMKHKDGTFLDKTRIITDKTSVDVVLYKQGIYSVNTIQSFLDLLKKASITSYDKEQDKNNRLEDYDNIKMSEEMIKACDVSDKRYLDSITETESDSSTVFSDIEDYSDIGDPAY